MGTIRNIFEHLKHKNLFENYLPIFRLFICFHIIKKIFINWGSISLLFEQNIRFTEKMITKMPYLREGFILDIPLIIQIVLVLTILFAFGIGKNITSMLLFSSWVLISDMFAEIGNGGDNLLFFILLYLPFTNSYKYFSFSKYKERRILNFVSNLAVYSIMIHLCLAYFISGIHKAHSDVWFNGVATYYILNLERFISPLNHLISKNAFYIVCSTYFTIMFELLFPFLIWFKQTRKVFLISGIFLHLSIYFLMMIYDFEILFISIYGFFITDSYYLKIINKVKNKFPKWQMA